MNTEALGFIEQELLLLLDEIDIGPGSNSDKLRYTKTKCTHLLAYIDSCYPDEQIHTGEPDVESANEGYV